VVPLVTVPPPPPVVQAPPASAIRPPAPTSRQWPVVSVPEIGAKPPVVPTALARAARTPVPAPVNPVEIGRPVPAVNVIKLGTPRLGVTSVGLVAKTIPPDPVTLAPSAETTPVPGVMA